MKKLISFKAVSTLMLAIAIVAASTGFALPSGYDNFSAKPWKFGVMGDTQWTTTDPAGANPDTVPLSIIDQVNQQFINAGVKFVIEVGDLTDDGNNSSEVTRPIAVQSWYRILPVSWQP